jgi:Leucine-rich repeat (LRR) protein
MIGLTEKIMNELRKTCLLFMFILSTMMISFSAKADVVLDTTNFPDANFRAYIATNTSVVEGGTISQAKLNGVTYINCSAKSIASLKGIENFTALTMLECANNALTSLDVSKNTALVTLGCYGNQLPTLDVSQLTALTALDCERNQLTSLDVSHNTALTRLECSNNNLTALDVSHNTALTSLDCLNNKITSLDVTKNTALVEFICSSNRLTALDVTKNTSLKVLRCYLNQITSLDVTKNTALLELYCDANPLKSLNLTKNTALLWLDCGADQLSTLDVTNNTALKYLVLSTNSLTTIDLSKNTLLETLWCNFNKITTIDVTHNTALTDLECNNNQLTSLDLSHNASLTQLRCDANELSSLNLSNNSKLKLFTEYANERAIKVYSYTRSAANGGGTGYYVPLTAQSATVLNGTSYGATKALATLIDEVGLSSDVAFDISKVVSNTWGGGAELGTLNGSQVLMLDEFDNRITYQYNTGFTGTCTNWQAYNIYDNTTVTAPNAYFTLKWSSEEVVTGVDGVADNDVDVYATSGAINIGGSFNGNVNVYNLSGQQVYCGTVSQITVPAGMYVVKVDGAVHKVLVK